MFIRHTEGVSWRAAPGVRRWRSTTVGVGSRWFFLDWLLRPIGWLFLAVPWLGIQIFLLIMTATIALVGTIHYHAPLTAVYFSRWGPFIVFDMEMPEGR